MTPIFCDSYNPETLMLSVRGGRSLDCIVRVAERCVRRFVVKKREVVATVAVATPGGFAHIFVDVNPRTGSLCQCVAVL